MFSPHWWGAVGVGRGRSAEVGLLQGTGWLQLHPEFRYFRTGQKVRTVCLSARSTLILLTFSNQGDMNFKIKGVCHVLYQSQYIHFIIRFRLFRVFSYGHLYHSVYLFIHTCHSLSRVIHICTYVSLAT